MSGERELEPTQRRLERAAAEGDVARSAEAFGLAAFAAAGAALSLLLPAMLATARALLIETLRLRRVDAAAAIVLVLEGCSVCAAAAMGAVAAGALQTRLALHPGALALRWERLNPAEGIKRLLTREAMVHLTRWVAVAAALALCGLEALRTTVGATWGDDPLAALGAAQRVCGALLLPALALGALGALWEYATARGARLQRLRMSRDEVRRELRESEGDPHHRARRARLHRSLRAGVSAVRAATLLVVNPTHVAVALRYDPVEAAVPVVLCKGGDERAAAMRLAAFRYNVPIVEEAALARLLYAQVDVGAAIPESAFTAVAVVIAAVLREARRGGEPA
ncbi:type III secretion protein [bacterium]|nr:MAG: type III secretion protein [bacterium]